MILALWFFVASMIFSRASDSDIFFVAKLTLLEMSRLSKLVSTMFVRLVHFMVDFRDNPELFT